MDGEGEDITGWMEEGKTLRDGWRRGRHYETGGGGEDITRRVEEGKTLRDGWRRGRHYETGGGGKDIMRLMGVWGQHPQQAEAML